MLEETDIIVAPSGPEALQRFWLSELKRAERAMEGWQRRCDKIIKRYRQQSASAANMPSHARRYALLWANIETLKPAVYSRAPEASVSRRNRTSDPVARTATEVIERGTNTQARLNGMDEVLRQVRDDYLLTARGQAWVRYEARIEPRDMIAGFDPLTGEPLAESVDHIADERAVPEYVDRRDFRHDPARTWREVGWVARRSFLTRAELLDRFGPIGARVGLNHKRDREEERANHEDREPIAKGAVWEIWSKRDNAVLWVAEEAPEVLESAPPHNKFDGFFPCPKPAYGTLTNEDLVPTPDYAFYQDQDEELDRLSKRIYALLDALKLIGFYAGGVDESGSKALQRAFKSGDENVLVPIQSWAAMGDKGSQIVWWPVDKVIQVLDGCYAARDRIVQQVYEITGLADIVRGASDPRETLGAQQIKAQWGSIRVRDRQAVLARFAQDLYRLMGEVVAEVFQPETIARMAEIEVTEPVLALLRDGLVRNFQIEVDTDALAQPDEDAEKQRRTEFLTGMAQFMTATLPIVQAQPLMLPMIGEMMKFGVRGFKTGRELEESIERTLDQLAQAAAAPKEPPGPPPQVQAAQIRAEADVLKTDKQAQVALAKTQADAAVRTRGQDMDAALTARDQDIRAMQGLVPREPTIPLQ